MALKSILYLAITLFVFQRTLTKPIIGLAFFAMIFFIRPETISYNELTFLRIPLLTSVIVVIGYFLNRHTLMAPAKSKLLVLFVLFYFVTVISTAQSQVINDWRWSQDYLKLVIFCFLITRVIQDEKSLNIYVTAILIGAGFLSIWGVDQHFRGNDRLEGVGGDRFGSNEFGVILVSILPLFLYKVGGKMSMFTNIKMKRLESLGFLLLSGFVVAAIIFTDSRGAFVGLCIAVSMMLMRAKHKFRTLLGLLILIPIVLPILPESYTARIMTIFSSKNVNRLENFESEEKAVDGSVEGRIVFWNAALHMFQDYPLLGVGLQNFELLTEKYTDGLYGRKDTHNTYLKVLAELGAIGLIIFLSMIGLAILNIMKTSRNARLVNNMTLSDYQSAVMAGLAGILVSALFGSYNYCEPLYWLLFLTVVLRSLSEQEITKAQISMMYTQPNHENILSDVRYN